LLGPVSVFPIFRDRREAGRALGEELARKPSLRPGETSVLALPRGGVPVGYEVAKALRAPLGVFIVRKLGVPGHRELAMGAIASGGIRVMNDDVVVALRIPEQAIDEIVREELAELQRREQMYGASTTPIAERDVVLVDDGLATGSTMRAAVRAVRAQHPKQIVVAVPVAATETCAQLADEADQLVCLSTPEPFNAVGLWYRTFEQTTDEEVRELLQDANRSPTSKPVS
jgi:putative phosphoribosyl transferase